MLRGYRLIQSPGYYLITLCTAARSLHFTLSLLVQSYLLLPLLLLLLDLLN